MANATAMVNDYSTPFTEDKISWPLVSTAQTYYPGAMIGRNLSGYATKFDDAASLSLLGINCESNDLEVQSGGSDGDKSIVVKKPRYISRAIASAAITDVGKLCYATFDNAVTFGSTTTYGNVVGRIVKRLSSTSVLIDTWDDGLYKDACRVMAATGAQTLTLWDMGKTIIVPNTAALTLTLPAIADVEAGAGFRLIKSTSDAYAVTLDGNASETINGASTYATPAVQYASNYIVSNGTEWIVTDSAEAFASVAVAASGTITMGEAANIVVGTSTGTKIGTATSQKIGFFNATPVVQPSAYTQTFSTADKTHANPTATALVLTAMGGTADGTLADVGNTMSGDVSAAIEENFKECGTAINALIVDLADLKALVNSVVDDLQALGLVG